ncbi:MAG: N-formylglutamate amidohydrolase [Opitutales bacterium]
MSPAPSYAPFFLLAPRGPAAAVVFDSPHSGMDWPPDFTPAAPREAILTTWDAYVDELWRDAPDSGATLLGARFPRAYIDVNRAVTDIDPTLLDAPWPGPLATTDHGLRGMGLIRRYALPGVLMYDRLLSVAAVQQRIAGCYLPYRTALKDCLDSLHTRFGSVWHVNCHSMKSRGNGMNTDEGRLRPDFVVSDRLGETCAPEFTAWTAKFLIDLGYSVQINEPYRGADIVRTHGDPRTGRHSLQIEINRALYMDETTCGKSAGFAGLQSHLGQYARALQQWVAACPPRQCG